MMLEYRKISSKAPEMVVREIHGDITKEFRYTFTLDYPNQVEYTFTLDYPNQVDIIPAHMFIADESEIYLVEDLPGFLPRVSIASRLHNLNSQRYDEFNLRNTLNRDTILVYTSRPLSKNPVLLGEAIYDKHYYDDLGFQMGISIRGRNRKALEDSFAHHKS